MRSRKQKQLLSLFHLVVLRKKGFIPSNKKSPIGGYCHCEPIQEFNITHRGALIAALRNAAAAGNPDMADCEYKAWKKAQPEPLFARAEVKNLDELEQKSICFTIECYPTKFILYWSKRREDGLWGSNLNEDNELVPDQIVPKEQGLEAVADAIVIHVNSRRDYPEIVFHPILLRFLARRQSAKQPVFHKQSK